MERQQDDIKKGRKRGLERGHVERKKRVENTDEPLNLKQNKNK